MFFYSEKQTKINYTRQSEQVFFVHHDQTFNFMVDTYSICPL